jgi:alpha-L-arabinofuranosidase
MKDIKATIYTKSDVRIYIDEWDNGGLWLAIHSDRSTMHTPLTRKEAEQMLQCLQDILAKEVEA